MVAYIGNLAVKRKKWLDGQTFKDGVALAQSIPGATAMQTVAFVGLQTKGVAGALLSYIGFGLPAFLLMLGFSALYAVSRSLPWVASVFSGLQVIVVAIVASSDLYLRQNVLEALCARLACGGLGPSLRVWGKPLLRHPGGRACRNAALNGETGGATGKGRSETLFRHTGCRVPDISVPWPSLPLPRSSGAVQSGPPHAQGRPFCLWRGLRFPAAHAAGSRPREGLDGREDIHGRHSPRPGDARTHRHHRRVCGIPDTPASWEPSLRLLQFSPPLS